MNNKDLADKLKSCATRLVEVAEDLMLEANINIKSDPRTIKLLIPFGMFEGEAIDTLNIGGAPLVATTGEKRMGGIDYRMVNLTIAHPLEYDPEQWEHVGSNTFVWRD